MGLFEKKGWRSDSQEKIRLGNSILIVRTHLLTNLRLSRVNI